CHSSTVPTSTRRSPRRHAAPYSYNRIRLRGSERRDRIRRSRERRGLRPVPGSTRRRVERVWIGLRECEPTKERSDRVLPTIHDPLVVEPEDRSKHRRERVEDPLLCADLFFEEEIEANRIPRIHIPPDPAFQIAIDYALQNEVLPVDDVVHQSVLDLVGKKPLHNHIV